MNFQRGKIPDPSRFDEVAFVRSIPTPEHGNWGDLGYLRDTSWESQIPEIPADYFEEAVLGWPLRFRGSLGTPPLIRAKRLPVLEANCKYLQDKSCSDRSEHCRPGSGKLPECYCAPFEKDRVCKVATEVGKAWDKGIYVFVVEE